MADPKSMQGLMDQYYRRFDTYEVVVSQIPPGGGSVFIAPATTGIFYGPSPLLTLPEGGSVPDSKCLHVAGRYYHTLQLDGDATTVTGNVQGSLNGTRWDTVQAIAALGLLSWTGHYKYLRVNITANSGGTNGLSIYYSGRA